MFIFGAGALRTSYWGAHRPHQLPTPMPVIYAELVSDAFAEKVQRIADRLDLDADYLMAIMHFETNASFSPDQLHPQSSATGLIQFLRGTARNLDTTAEELAAMTAVEQLEYVEKYFQPYKGRMETLEDAYMAVFWPRAIGRKPGYVLFDKHSAAYAANKYLDREGKGFITKQDAAQNVRRRYERGKREQSRTE